MNIAEKDKRLTLNLMLSLAMSLVVNFSYFVLYLTSPIEISKRLHIQSISPNLYLALQIGYFFLLTLVLLTVATSRLSTPDGKQIGYGRKMALCIIIGVITYFLAPVTNRSGELLITITSHRVFNPMTTLKCSFSIIVALLYGKVYELIYQKQNIAIENEQLRSENLESRYNMLMSQINPHFFFNSLNSLAMLIREKQNNKALEYIDELSDTFRYIIHNGQSGLTTLREELKFVEAYKYLLEMRYADKLFFEIIVNPQLYDQMLPALSLQPLIENAVKHNTITTQKPLRVKISAIDNHTIVVSNRMYPKLAPEEGTGIGLNNLSSRYKLLTNKDIRIVNDGINFAVELPLTKHNSTLIHS